MISQKLTEMWAYDIIPTAKWIAVNVDRYTISDETVYCLNQVKVEQIARDL